MANQAVSDFGNVRFGRSVKSDQHDEGKPQFNRWFPDTSKGLKEDDETQGRIDRAHRLMRVGLACLRQ